MTTSITSFTQFTGSGFYGTDVTIARQSSGRLWAAAITSRVSTTNTITLFYSDDFGVSWTSSGSATFNDTGTQTATSGVSLFIDDSGHGHLFYRYRTGASAGRFGYRFGTISGTTWSWSAEQQRSVTGTPINSDIIAFTYSATTYIVVSQVWNTGSHIDSEVTWYTVNRTTGALTLIKADTYLTSTSEYIYGLDFQHIGDGKTVKSSTPHIYYMLRQNTSGTRTVSFYRSAFAGGTWTTGAARPFGSGLTIGSDELAAAGRFDGTAYVAAHLASATSVALVERDAADTTTTNRATLSGLASDTTRGMALTYDKDRSVYLALLIPTGLSVTSYKWTRSTNTWGSGTSYVMTDPIVSTNFMRSYDNAVRLMHWSYDTISLVSELSYETVATVNSPPNAPSWSTGTGSYSISSALPLAWVFSDPDAGDSQSAYALRRTIGASVTYWSASTATWESFEVQNASLTSAATISAGWASDGDTVTFAAKVWDSFNQPSAYGGNLSVSARAVVNPTINSPAPGTWSSSSVLVTWSVISQEWFQVRLLSAGGASELYSSGFIVSSSPRKFAIPYVLADATSYRVELTTRTFGLLSDPITVDISVAYTPLAQPSIVIAPFQAFSQDAGYRITVSNNIVSAPPSLVSNEIWKRNASTTGDGWRIAVDVPEDGSFDDYVVASGKDYEYRCLAIADNGTTIWSEWDGTAPLMPLLTESGDFITTEDSLFNISTEPTTYA